MGRMALLVSALWSGPSSATIRRRPAWYGVANHRLIRDPANAALQQALSALVNSAPNSDQRAQLAKPGYDQLKAWLMMARPDKADGAFLRRP